MTVENIVGGNGGLVYAPKIGISYLGYGGSATGIKIDDGILYLNSVIISTSLLFFYLG